jgi:hypothetical protein
MKGIMYVYLLKVDKEIEPDLENAIDGEEHTEWGYLILIISNLKLQENICIN